MSRPARGAVRMESDTLGEVAVPADALWGAQTQRAIQNFPGGEPLPRTLLHALCAIKGAAAQVNADLDLIPRDVAGWIATAAEEGERGELDAQFPLGVWQSGSGTQTNMNVNEVLANRAAQLAGAEMGRKDPVHPNDHVNRCQSTNDVFPAAMHVAAVGVLSERVVPVLEELSRTLAAKAAEWDDVVKIGRTHLMDAVPMTLGQEFSGYAAQVRAAAARLEGCLPDLLELPLGGTAVGTGLSAHPDFARRVIERLARSQEHPFVPARSRFAGMAAHDAMVACSGALRGAAGALYKVANDIRWLGSGPSCGIGELLLPANEPGSSIMPGKVNPTQCEALTMACAQVMGQDGAVAFAGTQGNFELNVFKPLIADNVLRSMQTLADVAEAFCRGTVMGLTPRRDRIAAFVERSLMLATALAPSIGYDAAARVAHHAWEHDVTLREACMALGVITEEEFDTLVQPQHMIGRME